MKFDERKSTPNDREKAKTRTKNREGEGPVRKVAAREQDLTFSEELVQLPDLPVKRKGSLNLENQGKKRPLTAASWRRCAPVIQQKIGGRPASFNPLKKKNRKRMILNRSPPPIRESKKSMRKKWKGGGDGTVNVNHAGTKNHLEGDLHVEDQKELGIPGTKRG